jgi:hypothetical protein
VATAAARDVVLVVDVANVMGSRPDGWWRDRAGAATRLLGELAPLAGRTLEGPAGDPVRPARLVAVVEGKARGVAAPEGAAGLEVLAAPRDGDTAIAELAADLARAGEVPLVVTADRGLRARLPESAVVSGPGWLLEQARRA